MSNNKNVMIDSDEIEFNFIEAIKYLIRRTVSIFVIGLLSSIIFVLTVLSIKGNDDEYNSGIQEVEEKLSISHAKLQLEEENLKLQNEYIQDSILMKIQPNEVYSCVIQYYIDTTLERVNDITTLYSNYYSNGGLATDIYAKDSAIDIKYLKELVAIYCSNYGTYNEAAVLNVKIIGENEEACKKYASLAKEAIKEFSDGISKNAYMHELKQVQDMLYKNKDTNLQTQQNSAYLTLENIEASILEAKNDIEMYNDLKMDIESKYTVGTKELVKNILIGIVIGVLIAIVFYIFRYIVCTNVKYAEEISERTQLYCLGEYDVYNKNLSEKLINKFRRNDKDNKTIMARIQKECKDSQYDEISFIGNFDASISAEMENIDKALRSKSIKTNIIGDIVNNVTAITDFNKDIPAIIIVSSKNTNYRYFNKLIQVCNVKNVNIMGYIYVK